MDLADQAQLQNELAEEHNLQYRRSVPSIAPNGCCHNPVCDAPPFEDGSLKKFCDDRCAKEYERYNGR